MFYIDIISLTVHIVPVDTSPPSALNQSDPGIQASENTPQWTGHHESSALSPINDSATSISNREIPTPESSIIHSQGRHVSTTTDTATTTSQQDSCTCLPSALQILHAITLNESHTTIRNIPLTICLNKHVLQQSKSFFSCTHCTNTSTLTLLTVLCQQVISSYEHVISLLAQQYNALHNLSTTQYPCTSASIPSPATSRSKIPRTRGRG